MLIFPPVHNVKLLARHDIGVVKVLDTGQREFEIPHREEYADVAQQAVHRAVNPAGAGSTPAIGARLSQAAKGAFPFSQHGGGLLEQRGFTKSVKGQG